MAGLTRWYDEFQVREVQEVDEGQVLTLGPEGAVVMAIEVIDARGAGGW